MPVSDAYRSSQGRINYDPVAARKKAESQKILVRENDEMVLRAPNAQELGEILRYHYPNLQKAKTLTAYDRQLLSLKADLSKTGYTYSDEQIDTLLGSGLAKLPERQEELTLTLGSRSARRVSPYDTSASSLALGR